MPVQGRGHLAKWPELSGVDILEGEEVVKPLGGLPGTWM